MSHLPTARRPCRGPKGKSRVRVLPDVRGQGGVAAAHPSHVEPELRAGGRGRWEGCRGQPGEIGRFVICFKNAKIQ